MVLLLLSSWGCDSQSQDPAKQSDSSRKAAPSSASSATVQAAPPSTESAAESPPRIEQARAALLPLKKNLKATLTEALSNGGPAHAVEACKLKAPALPEAASTETATVGRSALKLRNPENAPPEWVAPLMKELAQQEEPAGTFRSAELPDGGFGYVESIVTGGMCVTCHGEKVPASVEAELDQRYPQDQARGFQVGSFRGVFWVSLNEG